MFFLCLNKKIKNNIKLNIIHNIQQFTDAAVA